MTISGKTCLAVTAAAGGLYSMSAQAQMPEHPNIVVIITDQQQAGKISALGDTGLSTPAMDRIVESGISFTNAYCTFPLSIPSRFALFTGMYPSDFNLRFNPGKTDRDRIDFDGIARHAPRMLANIFNEAGYDTYYGGKAHLVSPETNENAAYYGFDTLYSAERRGQLGKDAAEFISAKSPSDNPFLMVVSYINPHDICEYDDYIKYDELSPSVRKRKDDGISRVKKYSAVAEKYGETEFYSEICPQVPDNHAPMRGEPSGLPGKVVPYSEEQWQMHRWVYNRLIEEADSDIMPVLDALEDGGFMENTIIVFLSDHGEMDASHMREHKSVPYQEAQNVPFVISGPGIRAGKTDRKTVVNTGIDLLPTLCDLANIDIPDGYPGVSVKDAATGRHRLERRYIFMEGANWFQVLDSGRYKYTVIEKNGRNEILVDLRNDPGETVNLAENRKYRKILQNLRTVLADELVRRGHEMP